jgi:tyrosine-protein kinase Etk/Wzc
MENQSEQLQQEEAIDIRKFLFKIFQKWYWFVLSVSIAYAIAYVINRYSEPRYSLNATLIINDEKKSTADLLLNALDRNSARKNIENEIAVLKSYKMAYRTITELKEFGINYFTVGRVRTPILYKSAPFKVVMDTTSDNSRNRPVYITILNKNQYQLEFGKDDETKRIHEFGVPYRSKNFNFTIFLQQYPLPFATNKFYFVINDLGTLAKVYQGKLNIATNDKRSTVLTLSTTGFSPSMETDYLNKLMEMYIKTGLDEKNQTSINTINFIDEQLSTVVDSLRKAEDNLQNFRLNNKIVDISTEGTAIMGRLVSVQAEKLTVEMKLKYYKYIQSYIEKKKDFREVAVPSVMGIDDPLLNSLVSELASLYGERGVLAISAREDYPGFNSVNIKIKNTMDALQESIRQLIASTTLSLNELKRRQEDVEEEIQHLPITERKLLTIERNFKLNDQIYNFLLQRRADAAIARASNVADNKILDLAKSRDAVQISPKPSSNTMTAIIIALLIPFSVILLREFLNDKIMEPKDVEKSTKVPIYGSVGHNDEASDIPVAESPKSAIAESFRALRTNLQYVLRSSQEKVICISSTISGEGKTFSAVNLASIIAQSNKKTLLLSLDLRKPKIHKIFNLENDKGLSTYLIGRTSFSDTVHATNINNLFAATAGPVPPNPAELLETPLMDAFMTNARKEFDIIIMDTPPLAVVTDAYILTRFSSVFLFVVRQNYSSKSVIQLVNELHLKRGIQNVGIIINDVKVSNYYGRKYSYNSYGYNTYGDGYYDDKEKQSFKDRLIKFLFKS